VQVYTNAGGRFRQMFGETCTWRKAAISTERCRRAGGAHRVQEYVNCV
jgi:hypothetical protein